jgi:hypothetical protein
VTPLVCGVENPAPISVAWEADPVAELKYFEGGLNLTKLFAQYFPRDVCYISFQAKSRASTSLGADLEDFAQGELATCGSITVTKSTTPAGSPATFDFTVAGGPDPIAEAFSLTDGGSETVEGVRAGTYAITETLPAGWQGTAICTGGPFGAGTPYTNGSSFLVGPADAVTCAFHNTGAASITVVKETTPAGSPPEAFDFTVAGGPDGISTAFSMVAPAAFVVPELAPGTYTVTEAVPAGWILLSATCAGGPFGAGAPYDNGAPIELATGDEVVCTFTDLHLATAGAGAITVDKRTIPAGAPTAFDITVAGGPVPVSVTFALTDASPPRTTAPLDPGLYSITEAVPANWDLELVTCTGGVFGGGAVYVPGDPFQLLAGDQVTCTLVNKDLLVPGVGVIRVDKVTVSTPPGNPTLFDFATAGGPFAIDDRFQLAGATPPHATSDLAPGTYSVTEDKPAGWDLSARCSGGPFAPNTPYSSGAPFALNVGDVVSCTFTNTLRQAAPGDFCPGTSWNKILSPTSGRFPGNAGMDLIVRTDLGESIQDAVDNAADHNGDGRILIGVYGKSTLKPGGHTDERIVIDRAYPVPFALIGCSVTLHDPDPAGAFPTVHITASAGPDIFIMALNAEDSGSAGFRVEGDGRTLYSVEAARNAFGVRIVGSDNTIELGQFSDNAGTGLTVVGDRNRIIRARALRNGGHGFEMVGDDNLVDTSYAGDRLAGNGGDGVHVVGAGNRVFKTSIFGNAGDGIEVSGGTAARPNVLLQNLVGDYAKGNGGHGIFVHSDTGNGLADPIEIERNTVRSNGEAGIILAGSAPGHELRRNYVGGKISQDNGGCEFDVAAGNFNATQNTANGVTIAGADGTPFPLGCLGTP